MAVHYSPLPAPPQPSRGPDDVSTFWTWVALLIALVGLAGTMYLTVGMGLIPCPLCFYQRTAIMAIVGVLLMGLVAGPGRSGLLSLITLPVTVMGLGIAGFHVYLEEQGGLDCPDGALVKFYKDFRGDKKDDDFLKKIQGVVTAPKESLTIFVLLFLVQFLDLARSGGKGGFGLGGMIPAILIGGLFAAGLWYSMGDLQKKITRSDQGCIFQLTPEQEKKKLQDLEKEVKELKDKISKKAG
jgi:disulfide bond formation protein DsbB